jgi:hypothetical protein
MWQKTMTMIRLLPPPQHRPPPVDVEGEVPQQEKKRLFEQASSPIRLIWRAGVPPWLRRGGRKPP